LSLTVLRVGDRNVFYLKFFTVLIKTPTIWTWRQNQIIIL
jgi:hypothetical protein